MTSAKKCALVSVYDKKGLNILAKSLIDSDYTILSTGGTRSYLDENGIKSLDISEYTGQKELFSGRLKTLHPKVFGGILYDRKDPTHQDEKNNSDFLTIDLVVVNFYPFEKEAVEKKLSPSDAIHFIDIGGPSLLRAAAKNWQYCLSIIDPKDYEDVIEQIKKPTIDNDFSIKLATKVFQKVSQYDTLIANYFGSQTKDSSVSNPLPDSINLQLQKKRTLKYGENPHQIAAVYEPMSASSCKLQFSQHQGQDLSYNNYLDLESGIQLIRDLNPNPSLVILKHTNPCGVSYRKSNVIELFNQAFESDPISAFGGIIITNQEIDGETAQHISKTFFECIASPSFTSEALEIFKKKKRLRILTVADLNKKPATTISQSLKSSLDHYLVQTSPFGVIPMSEWKTVSEKKTPFEKKEELLFAMTVAKHLKSNAIVISKEGRTIGLGAGQMSRIDACQIAIDKAKKNAAGIDGSVMASDAFFPFRDCLDLAAQNGICAVVQPGGSKKDSDSIAACNEHRISMEFSNYRYFKH